MTTLTNLLDFDLPQLTDWVQSLGERPFRARQIFRWIHREGCEDFAAMSDVAKSLRAKLEEQAIIAAPRVLRDSVSRDGTRKWLQPRRRKKLPRNRPSRRRRKRPR